MSSDHDRVLAALRAAAREVAGLPDRLLTKAAHLEDDLGLRRDRRLEICRRAAERLGLDRASLEPDGCRTLGDLVLLIQDAAQLPGARAVASAPLAGKVALVTGSGHGLGKVLTRELASLGASVVINSFHSRARGEETAQELLAEGRDAVHVWGSVAQPHHLDRMFQEIEERHGRLDIFVSNASNGILSPLEATTVEHWEKGYRTNVIGYHQGVLRAVKLMKHGGQIIALSSLGAQRCFRFFTCQGTIKAAVEALTRYFAVELAPRNIQVNVVTAGPIYGEILMRFPEAEANLALLEACAVEGKLCSEEDVARFVTAFLLNPASSAVSGASLRIDAGHLAAMPGFPASARG